MIKELSDLPPGVVGFEATGILKAEDYRDVVLPALERASASGEDSSCCVVIDDLPSAVSDHPIVAVALTSPVLVVSCKLLPT